MINSKPPLVDIPPLPAAEKYSNAKYQGEDRSSCFLEDTINFDNASSIKTVIKRLSELKVSDASSEICLAVGAESGGEECHRSVCNLYNINGIDSNDKCKKEYKVLATKADVFLKPDISDLRDRGPPGGINVHRKGNYSSETRVSKGRPNLCEELRDDEEEHQDTKWLRPTQEKHVQNQTTSELSPFNFLPSIDPCSCESASRPLNFLAGYTARDAMSKTLQSFNKNKGDITVQMSSRLCGPDYSFISAQQDTELNRFSGRISNVSVCEELNQQGHTLKTVRNSRPSDTFALNPCRVYNEAKIMPLMGQRELIDAFSKIAEEDIDIRRDGCRLNSCCQRAYSECASRVSDLSFFFKDGHAEIVTPKLTQEDIEDIFAYINTDAGCSSNLSKEHSALNPVVSAMFYKGAGDQPRVTNFDSSLVNHHRIHSKGMSIEYSQEFVKNSELVSREEEIDHYISQMIDVYGVLECSEQSTPTYFSENICLDSMADQIAETVSIISSVHSPTTDVNGCGEVVCLTSVVDNKCGISFDQAALSSLKSVFTDKIELDSQQAPVCARLLGDDDHLQVHDKYDSGSFQRELAVQSEIEILTPNLLEQDQDGDTMLHRAMIDENWSLVDVLLKQCETDGILRDIVCLQNNYEQTLLCLAVIFNRPELVETLINHGADANTQIRKMQSDPKMGLKFDHPIHFAVNKGQFWLKTLVMLLRSEQMNINSINSEGRSAVHCAIDVHGKAVGRHCSTSEESCGQIDSKPILTLLAEAGADINLPDTASEETPLHFAIRRKHLDLVVRLLTLATNSPNQQLNSVCKLLESKTGSGNSALHLAAMTTMDIEDQKKLVQMLLSRGADPSCKNDEGHLPREVAKNAEVVELLKGKNSTRVSSLCSSTALARSCNISVSLEPADNSNNASFPCGMSLRLRL